MGKNSSISWTDATFNPWIGCSKVSAGCSNCYAETLMDTRWKRAKWGAGEPRVVTSDSNWREPIKWNAAAAAAGVRKRVFCASLADVFEDHAELPPLRARLWELIEKTPWLDWMLLTKRAGNIAIMLPTSWQKNPRPNVWLGVTAENQATADERIPQLLRVPAAVHWISAEPLLGPVSFRKWLPPGRANFQCQKCQGFVNALSRTCPHCGIGEGYFCGSHAGNKPDPSNKFSGWTNRQPLDWIIVGGESGHHARPMDAQWARDILAECKAAGIAYHFKQKGEVLAKAMGCKDAVGKDPAEWPEDLRVQEFPKVWVA